MLNRRLVGILGGCTKVSSCVTKKMDFLTLNSENWLKSRSWKVIISLEKRPLRWDLITAYQYLQGGCQEDEARPLSVVPSNRRRGNRHKLMHRKFCLRKNFFTMQATEHWIRMPRKVVGSPSPKIFKTFKIFSYI